MSQVEIPQIRDSEYPPLEQEKIITVVLPSNKGVSDTQLVKQRFVSTIQPDGQNAPNPSSKTNQTPQPIIQNETVPLTMERERVKRLKLTLWTVFYVCLFIIVVCIVILITITAIRLYSPTSLPVMMSQSIDRLKNASLHLEEETVKSLPHGLEENIQPTDYMRLVNKEENHVKEEKSSTNNVIETISKTINPTSILKNKVSEKLQQLGGKSLDDILESFGL